MTRVRAHTHHDQAAPAVPTLLVQVSVREVPRQHDGLQPWVSSNVLQCLHRVIPGRVRERGGGEEEVVAANNKARSAAPVDEPAGECGLARTSGPSPPPSLGRKGPVMQVAEQS